MLNRLKEEYGFKGIIVDLINNMKDWPKSKSSTIYIWQIEGDDCIGLLGGFSISNDFMDIDVVDAILRLDYNGNDDVDDSMNGVNCTRMIIIDKKYEALEWLRSLSMMCKLYD